MNVVRLAVKNLRGNAIRSLTIFLCVLGIVSFFMATTLVVQGAQNSLNKGLERLGADIVVVPEGAESKVETALLMGKPTQVWMSSDILDRIAKVPGVGVVSPQIYLESMFGAPCCSVEEMFMVAFDPSTDFTVTPWLEKNLGRGLDVGQTIGGTYVFVPEGDTDIQLYGYRVTLDGTLEPTGTGLDQTMFMTMDTARAIQAASVTEAERPMGWPQDEISTVMVKVAPGVDPHRVALQIALDVPGVVPLESPSLFGAFRDQMIGLLWVFMALLGLAWVLSTVMIGLVFSMAANERRREIAVLRALGSTRYFVFETLLSESALLALAAGVLGIGASSFIVYLARDYLAASLRMPFLFPSPGAFLVLALAGLGLSLATVAIATLLPAWKTSRAEPALAMRE